MLTIPYTLHDSLGATSVGTVYFILIGLGENDGVCSNCSSQGGAMSVGSPINVTTGNMYLQQSDYSLPSVGPGLGITRTFNSDSSQIGLFGRGWSTAYDESISIYDDSLLRFKQADGRAVYFSRPAGSSGAFTELIGDLHAQVTQSGNGFALSLKDGSVHQFNAAGQLLAVADRNGNTTNLTYAGNGFLSSSSRPVWAGADDCHESKRTSFINQRQSRHGCNLHLWRKQRIAVSHVCR